MQTQLDVVEGLYLRDILDQPAALRRSLDLLRSQPSEVAFQVLDVLPEPVERVVLTGMGSSFHALHPLYLRLNRAGMFAQMVETSELVHYLPELITAKTGSPHTLIVAVSQSGESAEIIRLLDHNEMRVPILGVTNSPASSLARRSTVPILLAAGLEATVSCKTYLATLQALHWIGSLLIGDDLDWALAELSLGAPAVQEYLDSWRDHVHQLAAVLGEVRQIFITGRGPSLATAGTGGLILKESARFSAEGMSSAAFRHGPFEMLSSRIFVAVCLGDSRSSHLNSRLVTDIRTAGGQAALIGAHSEQPALRLPDAPPSLLPTLEILPIQMISLALASLQGHEAGQFAIASKITAKE